MKLEDVIKRIGKKSFIDKLFLIINIIQFTSRENNNVIIMYGLLNAHGLPYKISGLNS